MSDDQASQNTNSGAGKQNSPLKYGPTLLIVVEIASGLMTVAGAVAWLVGKNWLAASLCGAGLLLLTIAVFFARSKVHDYFKATLATLLLGVLMIGAAMGVALSSEDMADTGPRPSGTPSTPSESARPDTPNPSPATFPPSASTSPSGHTSAPPSCKTPPYQFPAASGVSGAITTPMSAGRVAQWFNIEGELQGLPANRSAFLVTELVGRPGNEVWDAQKCFANVVWPVPVGVGTNGHWNTRIALGAAESKYTGSVYKVTLVLVDANAEYQFRAYIKKAEEEKKYPGVETARFAGAIEEVARVTLTRL